MAAEYDVFLSHAWADGDRPQRIADALERAGLRVWFDAQEIHDFASITRAVTEGLARSKALVAFYSAVYPMRRACQWELTAAFLAAQAEGDPRRRVLVINPERTAEHIHPVELRDAKFLKAPEDDGAGLEELVQAIARQVEGLDGPLAAIRPLSAPQWYGQTPVGSTRFVGRLAEMWRVHSLLHAGDVTQITGAAVATGGIGRVSGLGGVGKSLLAEEYALRFGAAYPGGVFWLRAYGNDDAKGAMAEEQRDALRTDQIRQFAERLGIETQGKTPAQIEGDVTRWIAKEGKRCLWVVDDVPNGWEGETMRRWFAPHTLVRTLVTTRSREYGAMAQGIDLAVLMPEEALQLLTSRRTPVGEEEEEAARGLAQDLGYHALAVDVTASALESSVAARPFEDFRARLGRPDRDAMLLAESLAADALPNGHEKSIAQTLLRSIRALRAEGLDFLRLASVLAVAPIPASLVVGVFEDADELSREDAEERASLAFRQVTFASLAEVAGERQDARSVHTLVSRVVRFHDEGAAERAEVLRAGAIRFLAQEIAKVADDPRLHAQIELHVGHARQVVRNPVMEDDCKLVSWVARYDYTRGMYGSAHQLYERVLEVSTRVLGEDHRDTLTAMNNLAQTLWSQGDHARARRLEDTVLEVRFRVLGEEHPDTLTSMHNLASTLWMQGDRAEACKLQKRVLEVKSRVLGAEHPSTLLSMGNLAETLRSQGDHAGARRLHERVLEVSTRVLGEDHPDTLKSMNNLALTLHSQGDYAGALNFHERELNLSARVLGREHPDTLISMTNLAATLWSQGDYVGAHRLEERGLEVMSRVLGEEHPRTLTLMGNLAFTLVNLGERGKALELFRKCLAGRRKVLGDQHPDTIATEEFLRRLEEELSEEEGSSG